jgi:hypothetical protein
MPASSRSVSAVASLLLMFASAAPALAQSTSPGWMYTMNMTTDSGGKRSSMATKYQVTDQKLRMEFVQVSGMAGAAAAEGMVQILDDRDSSMAMLMPGQHMVMVMHLSEMLGNMPGIRAQMMPKIEQHLTANRTEDLGAGERILGHATHRYRVTQAGTMDVTVAGRTCTRKIDSVNELWMAPDVDLMPTMRTMMKHYDSALGVGTGASDVRAAGSDLKGTALRTITKSAGLDAQGRAITVTSTIEFVEMSQAPISASVFTLPADYQTMDMGKMMADIPAGVMDSVMAQQASKGQNVTQNAICGVGAP